MIKASFRVLSKVSTANCNFTTKRVLSEYSASKQFLLCQSQPLCLKGTTYFVNSKSSLGKSLLSTIVHNPKSCNDNLITITKIERSIYELVCKCFRKVRSYQQTDNMSISADALAQLENNYQTADNLIREIYSKLNTLQNSPNLGDAAAEEVTKLLKENEALKKTVNEWREMLILQQIRNGGNPIVRDPKLVERSSEVTASVPVKQEPKNEAPAKQEAEVNVEQNVAPQQSQAKKAKKGGDANAPAKGGKGKDAAAIPDNQANEEVDVGRLDLRIGLIKECTRHPDADSLYVEKIDVGEANVRTVISGLVKHVPIEQMQNRMVVVLCNLKPSKMRGISSEAMVMCASSPEKVEILTPPTGSVPGDIVEVDGYTRRPDAVLNPKKKIFETVAPDLKTNDSKQATYKGVPWTVPGKGFVVSESLCNVNVK